MAGAPEKYPQPGKPYGGVDAESAHCLAESDRLCIWGDHVALGILPCEARPSTHAGKNEPCPTLFTHLPRSHRHSLTQDHLHLSTQGLEHPWDKHHGEH